jgi:hypothetical protein
VKKYEGFLQFPPWIEFLSKKEGCTPLINIQTVLVVVMRKLGVAIMMACIPIIIIGNFFFFCQPESTNNCTKAAKTKPFKLNANGSIRL